MTTPSPCGRREAAHKYGENTLNNFLTVSNMYEKFFTLLCFQVRQWQHWGSGCYNYVCEDNRLHIIVLNSTYTCFYGGQELKVQYML